MSPRPAIRTRTRRLASRSLAGTLPGRVQLGAVAGHDRGRGFWPSGLSGLLRLWGRSERDHAKPFSF